MKTRTKRLNALVLSLMLVGITLSGCSFSVGKELPISELTKDDEATSDEMPSEAINGTKELTFDKLVEKINENSIDKYSCDVTMALAMDLAGQDSTTASCDMDMTIHYEADSNASHAKGQVKVNMLGTEMIVEADEYEDYVGKMKYTYEPSTDQWSKIALNEVDENVGYKSGDLLSSLLNPQVEQIGHDYIITGEVPDASNMLAGVNDSVIGDTTIKAPAKITVSSDYKITEAEIDIGSVLADWENTDDMKITKCKTKIVYLDASDVAVTIPDAIISTAVDGAVDIITIADSDLTTESTVESSEQTSEVQNVAPSADYDESLTLSQAYFGLDEITPDDASKMFGAGFPSWEDASEDLSRIYVSLSNYLTNYTEAELVDCLEYFDYMQDYEQIVMVVLADSGFQTYNNALIESVLGVDNEEMISSRELALKMVTDKEITLP